MKKLILILYMSLPLIGYGQVFKPDLDMKSSYKNEPAYMLDTVADSKLTKQQLYSNALNYVSKSFSDSRAVIEMKDADLGEISFKGLVPAPYVDTLRTEKRKKVIENVITDEIDLHFKCKIYVKDQKYKVVLSSLEAPMNSLFADIPMTLSMENDRPANEAAKEAAMNLILSISEFLNRTPENEF